MTTSKTVVGENIRRIRRDKGMSPEQFAVSLQCSVQQVFNYEGGRSRITEQVIKKASQILEVPIEELFAEEADA